MSRRAGILTGVDYDQFDAEYGRVLSAAPTLDAASAADEVSRLRELAATIDEPADRAAAGLLLASLEDALSTSTPQLSPAMAAAVRVHARAGSQDGTVAERIERARAGMAEIGRIAATAETAEQGAILDLNESLSMLVDALSPGTGAADR